jgi:hypothetical protein
MKRRTGRRYIGPPRKIQKAEAGTVCQAVNSVVLLLLCFHGKGALAFSDSELIQEQ